MNKMKFIFFGSSLFVLILASACGTTSNTESSKNTNMQQPETKQENTAAYDATQSDEEILIVIDQTAKPMEGNSFDFVVNQVPEGYSLTEMQWISDKSRIVNTTAEAVQHGANGEDGFYISGNGQYSGFIYPDSMKGEEGEVTFVFKNGEGKELTWKKQLTLK